MNGENERPAASGLVAEHIDDLARLPQIEAVERLIHQQDGMRRQQRQRQQKATVIPLRQRMYALVEDGPESHRSDRVCGLCRRSPVDACKKRHHLGGRLVPIRAHAIRQIKECVAPLRRRQRLAMPENLSGIRGKEADNRFQQSGLAGAIRSDNAEHLARGRRECHTINRRLLAVPFRQICDA